MKLCMLSPFLLVIVVFGGAGGCSNRKPEPSPSSFASKETKPVLQRYKTGDLDEKGRPVLYADGVVPLVLKDDYGVMLVNTGNPENPSPLYILGILKEKRVFATRDRTAFEAALKAIPKGSRVQRYDKCTTSFSDGLSGGERVTFDRLVRRSGGPPEAKSDEWDITCTCRSEGGG